MGRWTRTAQANEQWKPLQSASIAQHELERGGNFAFSTTAASTATASTAELQLRSGSQYVGGSCG